MNYEYHSHEYQKQLRREAAHQQLGEQIRKENPQENVALAYLGKLLVKTGERLKVAAKPEANHQHAYN